MRTLCVDEAGWDVALLGTFGSLTCSIAKVVEWARALAEEGIGFALHSEHTPMHQSLLAFAMHLHIIHVASAFLMLGVVLVAQRVMYPGFAYKDPARFADAMRHHQRSIGPIVAPSMLAEGASAVLLLALAASAPQATPAPLLLAIANIALLASCWVLTFATIVPMHMRLTTDAMESLARSTLVARLVRTHWWRTLAWSLHAILASIMLALALRLDTGLAP